MDRERYQRLKDLFHRADGLSGEDLDAFVEEHCGDDVELADALRGMLAPRDDGAVGRALDEPAGASTAGAPERIGRYRVVGLIGRGGMGTVYEAEQDAPKRRVAVKVVHASLLRPETRRRFRREAEILGRLQHPGIAQVYEAGEAELNGGTVPFIAMEYVVGAPLLRHAEDRGLDVDARLELFCEICDAVQHAHERGVVHRDLKPDNVLVVESTSAGRARGHPKVLDFGVARLTESDLEATLSTGTGHIVGSLASMSPEQAAGGGARVDARSDVYSLGMVLFELLARRLPYRVDGVPLADALDTICNEDAAPLDDVVPGIDADLATIVGTCLEKSPDRRYASASALADDLRRHLRRETIVARRPGTWYRARRFARRHRALVVGTAAVVVALGVGLALAVASAVDARRSEESALVEAQRANLLAADALADVDPTAARRALEAVPEARRGWEWRHLRARLSRSLLDFGAYHPTAPLAVVDDGALVFAAADARTLAGWDVETGAERERHVAPGEVVRWGVSPRGDRLAAGLADGRVVVSPRATTAWEVWAPAGPDVDGIVFAPDGGTLAVVRADGVDVGGADGWWRVDDEGDWPRVVAFAPDGRRLVVGGLRPYAPYALVVDVEGRQVTARATLGEEPRDVSWDDAGRLFVAGGNRTVLELDPVTLARRARLAGHSEPVVDVDVDAGGRVVSAAADGTLRVWTPDGAGQIVLDAPGVVAVACAGGDRLVSASADGLRLWDLRADARAVLADHGSYVYDVAFSPDGRRLVSMVPFEDPHLELWDLVEMRRLLRRPMDLWKPDLVFGDDVDLGLRTSFDVRHLDLASGVTQTQVVTPPLAFGTTRRETGRVWVAAGAATEFAAQTDAPIVLRVEHAVGLGFTAWVDGKQVARDELHGGAPGEHPRLFVGNLRSGFGGFAGSLRDVVVIEGLPGADEARALDEALAARWRGEDVALPVPEHLRLLAHLDADHRWLETDVTTSDGERVEVVEAWRARDGEDDAVLRRRGASRTSVRTAVNEHGATVVRFDNLWRRIGWLEGPLEAARGAERVTVLVSGVFDSDWRAGVSVAYTLGDVERAFVDWDGRAPELRRFGVGRSLSADGARLVDAKRGEISSVIVRDTATGEALASFGTQVYGADIAPDGRRVAGARHDGGVDVWDIDAGALEASLDAHDTEAYAVTWSPDGTRLVTGGNDNLVRVWDTTSWELLLTLRGHGQYIKAVAFSPDGARLASASGDGTVRVWDARDPAARHAERLADRALADALRDDVVRLLDETGDAAAAAAAIRARWATDDARRAAALVLLAGLRDADR